MAEINVTKKIIWTIRNVSEESFKKFNTEENTDKGRTPSEVFAILIGKCVTKWSLRLYPSGDDEDSRSHLSMFLCSQGSELKNVQGHFNVGLKDSQGNVQYFIENDDDFQPIKEFNDGRGYSKWISQEELFDEKKQFVNDGFLEVVCEINLCLNAEDTPLVIPKTNGDEGLVKMFTEDLFCDFRMKMSDGKVLDGHKALLAAKSSVFSGMLSSGLKEVKDNFVEITDFDSINMKEALRWMYTGVVDNLDEMAPTLILVAERYDLGGLKEICIDNIIKNLTCTNVIQAIAIADDIGDLFLAENCLGLIDKHFGKINAQHSWRYMDICLKSKVLMILKEFKENIIYVS